MLKQLISLFLLHSFISGQDSPLNQEKMDIFSGESIPLTLEEISQEKKQTSLAVIERRFFGTDGIRAEANTQVLCPSTIVKIAMASCQYFKSNQETQFGKRALVVIGKDTRISSDMIQYALASGLMSMGVNVLLLGEMPTPAVAYFTRYYSALFGIMITASHNPAKDNGIKFFRPDGFKLDDYSESQIESLIEDRNIQLSSSLELGKIIKINSESLFPEYIRLLKSSLPPKIIISKLKIVIDCAHGAAYKIAPLLFKELGTNVIPLFINPDGLNINDHCGATDVKALQENVLSFQADIGFALDGDADRLIVVDEIGNILDGDQILCAIAIKMKEEGTLLNDSVVATHMSNLGMQEYLNRKNITLLRTSVGDRYVLDEMRKTGCNLGGEQSGHIIITDYTSTGDGLLASLQLLNIMVTTQRKASEIGKTFIPVPQKLVNVEKNKTILSNPSVDEAIQLAKNLLSRDGRVYIRPSGTEPLIRVMVEARKERELDLALDIILKAMKLVD